MLGETYLKGGQSAGITSVQNDPDPQAKQPVFSFHLADLLWLVFVTGSRQLLELNIFVSKRSRRIQ
jgi:hypothetical protein